MNFTGERLVLGKKGIEQLEMEHLHRYTSIKELVKGKVVLDIACGTGYGSALLSEKAQYVYGVDISPETIEYCKQNYNKCNLSFQEGNVCEIPLEDHKVDIVVSYETIEHISEENQLKFKKEIKRVLKQNGLLIMSTPNKYVYSDIPKYRNEFHIKEFYKDEFETFLRDICKNVKIFSQGLQICDVIDDGKQSKKHQLEIKAENKNRNLYQYMIAICSNNSIEEINLSSIILDKDNLLFLLTSKYNDINQMLSMDSKKYSEKNIIEQKENYIQEQREELENRHIIIEQKENYIQEQKEELENRRIIIEQKENYIQEQRVAIENEKDKFNKQQNQLKILKSELERIKSTKCYKLYTSINSLIRRKN